MIELNPDDPFDSVIIDMIQMNRKKRNDYAADSDIFSNFRDTSADLGLEGFGPVESCQVLLLTKVARLKSLRLNGRMANPSNESVLDTFLDLAVYATILLALVKEEGRKTNADSSPTEEVARPRSNNVRFRGSVAPNEKDETEKTIRQWYRDARITEDTFNSLMEGLRGGLTASASAENNGDEEVSLLSSEFRD